MNRRQMMSTLGATGALLTGLAAVASRAADSGENPDIGKGDFDKCAKACADCMNQCDACFRHCANLVAHGHQDHVKTMNLCVDCGELCGTAAKLAARQSQLAVQACEACAKACDVCGAECGKFPEHAQMKACAKACRDCAKACREMIKQVGSNQH